MTKAAKVAIASRRVAVRASACSILRSGASVRILGMSGAEFARLLQTSLIHWAEILRADEQARGAFQSICPTIQFVRLDEPGPELTELFALESSDGSLTVGLADFVRAALAVLVRKPQVDVACLSQSASAALSAAWSRI